ncbi:MAG: hypothetical protein IJT16_03285 [Lachnospiraceae bacterium]|nr:hypothetical protein [Lachnospiraceae bacterium]
MWKYGTAAAFGLLTILCFLFLPVYGYLDTRYLIPIELLRGVGMVGVISAALSMLFIYAAVGEDAIG